MPALDPRSPLVLDTRELGRRPGTMQTVLRRVPAPADLGSEVIGVPAGAELELDLRLESVMEGVLISGTASARADGECVRCLDDVHRDVEVEVQELFAYPGRTPAGEADEDDVHELQGDLIDLEPVLRDALVPALPFQPVCSPQCPGLCAQCGARLADSPGHRHEDLDPRWAVLRQATDRQHQPLQRLDDERES